MLFTDSMSLGDKLINGLGVTLLGMGVVFAVLVILSFALDILRISAGENNKKKATPNDEAVKTDSITNATNITDNAQQDDEEIIAVISAAIASLSGNSIEEFFIKSIKPVPQKNNVWATIGRQERMLDRL
jgi:sodium pump decarboxylase gamma subunit